MFRFTQTIIRELQSVLSQNYISGSSIHVGIVVFSVMAAYNLWALVGKIKNLLLSMHGATTKIK